MGQPGEAVFAGVSGNPSGRPKRFSIHELVAEAIDDNDTRLRQSGVQEKVKNRHTVLSTPELADCITGGGGC